MKNLLIPAILILSIAAAASAQAPEGIWQGYEGEWKHVSQQLIALAEATPQEKLMWRPAPGIRSASEVYMHIVIANFWLLTFAGREIPGDLKIDSVEEAEKSVTNKEELIAWLKRSLDAVQRARGASTEEDLGKKVHIGDRDATVDGIYLRILVHANEHMGQLIAYARTSGVKPPWAEK